jgi:hypothetical protein
VLVAARRGYRAQVASSCAAIDARERRGRVALCLQRARMSAREREDESRESWSTAGRMERDVHSAQAVIAESARL